MPFSEITVQYSREKGGKPAPKGVPVTLSMPGGVETKTTNSSGVVRFEHANSGQATARARYGGSKGETTFNAPDQALIILS